jgi:hypothetical protein
MKCRTKKERPGLPTVAHYAHGKGKAVDEGHAGPAAAVSDWVVFWDS